MNPEMNPMRLLTLADLDRAAEIMSRAFYDDPLWQYLLLDGKKRQNLMPKFYKVFLTAWIRNQQAYGVSDPIEGIAVWSAPNQAEFQFSASFGTGFLKLLFSPIGIAFVKSAPIFSRFEVMQKQYAPDPHYYLNTIAVSPEAQGKGLASKLIKPFLAKADEQRVSAYTETMTPANVGLYEHYGFRCMEQHRIPQTDLSIWSFYRSRKT
jgi:ribosomal protein S18 acetylase RimI-like enzyme